MYTPHHSFPSQSAFAAGAEAHKNDKATAASEIIALARSQGQGRGLMPVD